MSFVKARLKLARESIGKKDFVSAHDAANQVLEIEPENYNAFVSTTPGRNLILTSTLGMCSLLWHSSSLINQTRASK